MEMSMRTERLFTAGVAVAAFVSALVNAMLAQPKYRLAVYMLNVAFLLILLARDISRKSGTNHRD